MSRKQYDDDDGRTIVDMNVEGMPEYSPFFIRRHRKTRTRRVIGEDGTMIEEQVEGSEIRPQEEMSKKDVFRSICSATLAGLVVALVFSAGIILFTLFCTGIWFK